jgi:hypothetical protein
MVLWEKLEKIEDKLQNQATVIGKIEEATYGLKSNTRGPSLALCQPRFSPAPLKSSPVMFQVPKGGLASLDHFLSLSFVRSLLPDSQSYRSLVCDDSESRTETRLPNLEKNHVQKLYKRFLEDIYPIHSIIDIPILDQMLKELEEDGLLWTGESAVIMQILAIGCILAGEDPLEYNCAAKRRMGFSVEQVNILAIQAHYLLGYRSSIIELIARQDLSTMRRQTRTFISRFTLLF